MQTVAATPTTAPLDATKQADDARWEQELATAAALVPTPLPEEPAPTDEPLEPLDTGISTDCESLYDRFINEVNCWQDILNGEFVFVAAGAEPTDATQGKLVLYTADPDSANTSEMEEYVTPSKAGTVTITQVQIPRLNLTASDGTPFVFNVATRSWEAAAASTPTPVTSACELYPIALHSSTITGASSGQELSNILNGSGAGNFGWLSWTDDQSANSLAQSLIPPGDSTTYMNPNDLTDHKLSTGDYVRGRPGVTNSNAVRQALDTLISRTITVPVWEQAVGKGKNLQYSVVGFAKVQITSYQLASQNQISVRYQGPAICGN